MGRNRKVRTVDKENNATPKETSTFAQRKPKKASQIRLKSNFKQFPSDEVY